MPGLVLIYGGIEFVITVGPGRRQDRSCHFISPLVATNRMRLFQRGKAGIGFCHNDDPC